MRAIGTILYHIAISIAVLYIFGFTLGLALAWNAGQSGNSTQAWVGFGLLVWGPLPFIGTALLAEKLNPDIDSPQGTNGRTP